MQSSVVSNTFSLIISKLIPSALLALINIIYSRYLSHTEYGTYQILWTYTNIFMIVTTFGLPRYIITFGGLNNSSKAILRISILIFTFTIIPIAVYFIFFDKKFDLPTTILFIALILSQSIFLIREAYTISLLANKILVFANCVYAILLFLIHVIVLYIGYDLKLCVFLIIIVSLIRNTIIKYTLLKRSTTLESGIQKIDTGQLLWFGSNDTLQILTRWIDKIILIALLPASAYAIYFNGTYEIPLIGVALTAFQTIITVQSAQPTSTDEKNIELFNTSTLFMAGILFPLFSLCFVYAHDIITLFYSSSYSESVKLFAISSLLIPIRICNYTVLLQLKSKGRTILTGSIIDFVLTIILMMVLYPHFGLNGLAMAVVIATYVQALFYLFNITSIYKKNIFDLFDLKKLIPRFIISSLPLLAIKLLSNNAYPQPCFIMACIIALTTSGYFINKSFNWRYLIKKTH